MRGHSDRTEPPAESGSPDAIHEFASFLPRFCLRKIANRPEPPTAPTYERFQAAILMVDLSGFSRLSEQYATRGNRGADELSQVISRYFDQTSSSIIDHGGDVLFFAGDAVLGMWPAGDDLCLAASRATQCGLAVQSQPLEGIPAEADVQRYAAVSVGPLAFIELGARYDEWLMLFVGEPIRQLASAIEVAQPGETVLSPPAWEILKDRCQGTTTASGDMRLDAFDAPVSLPDRIDRLEVSPDEKLLRRHVPEFVADRISGDAAHWIAEFRNASIVFLNLPGFDFNDTHVVMRIESAFAVVQQKVSYYEGNLHHFRMDEKGLSVIIAFGLPPLSHERDPERALEVALSLRDELNQIDIRSSIGVATGQIFCGVCGSPLRRQYTILGPTVNLAARFMQHATDDILCDQVTARAASARIESQRLEPLPVKGWDEPVPLYRPQTTTETMRSTFGPNLLGRDQERRQLRDKLRSLTKGQGGLVVVLGEAGIGKSHLLADLVDDARSQDLTVLSGEGDAIEHSTRYFAWRKVLQAILDWNGDCSAEARRAELSARLGADEKLRAWAPLAEDILPMGFKDNDITSQMESAARADATREIVTHLLREFTAKKSMVLVFDDAHWCDPSSLVLISRIIRRLPELLVIIGTRPVSGPGLPELDELISARDAEKIALESLPVDAIRALVAFRLGVGAVPDALVELIWRRAEGHPFYSEELALTLRDTGLIEIRNGALTINGDIDKLDELSLPNSLQGIITSRIDRLPASAQFTVKAASVIGRVFSYPMLASMYKPAGRTGLEKVLDLLVQQDVVHPDSTGREPTYSFKHVIMRDVIYEMMLYSQRQPLHRKAAEWIEQRYAGSLEAQYALLAHHWEYAGEVPKTLQYLERAGEQALRVFSNREAVEFFTKAITFAGAEGAVVEDLRRSDWERYLGEGNLKMSNYGVADRHFQKSLQMRGVSAPQSNGLVALDLLAAVGKQVSHQLYPSTVLAPASRRASLKGQALAFKGWAETALFHSNVLANVARAFRYLNAAELAGDTTEELHACGYLSVLLGMFGLRKISNAYNRRALALVEHEENLHARAYAWQVAAVHGISIGNWPLVDQGCTHASAGFAQLGDRFRWEMARCLVGYHHLLRGEFRNSYKAFEEAYASAHPDGAEQIRIWARAGQLAGLESQGKQDPHLVSDLQSYADLDLHPTEALLTLGVLARATLAGGDEERALVLAERALEVMTSTTPALYYLKWPVSATVGVYLSLAQSDVGGRAKGREFRRKAHTAYSVLRRIAFMNPVARPSADHTGAMLAWSESKRRRAFSLWRRSATTAERTGMPLDEALARFELGRHLPLKHAARYQQLNQASKLFDALDMKHNAEQTRALL